MRGQTDCLPTDATAWSLPEPATALSLAQNGADTELSWTPPEAAGATGVAYEVVRSDAADDFGAATCVLPDGDTPQAADSDVPAGVFFYLVRVENGCGGNLGATSAGQARSAADCTSGR